MPKYLITHTLLSNWEYIWKAEDTESAIADFTRYLRREPAEQTQAMLDGIAFESCVYRYAASDPTFDPSTVSHWVSGIAKVAERIHGAPTQIRLSRPVTVDGQDYLVYGALDALKAGEIFDVKYSTKSFDSVDIPGKYLESTQHPIYFYLCPSAYRFTYLVSDGTDLHAESYAPEDTKPLQDIIREFISSIAALGLLDTYHEHWAAR